MDQLLVSNSTTKLCDAIMFWLTCYTGGTDYSHGPYTVEFPANEIKASFNVSIINDDILELNEIFSLFISPSSHIVAGYPDRVLVMIEDDDSE